MKLCVVIDKYKAIIQQHAEFLQEGVKISRAGFAKN